MVGQPAVSSKEAKQVATDARNSSQPWLDMVEVFGHGWTTVVSEVRWRWHPKTSFYMGVLTNHLLGHLCHLL